MSNKQLPWAPQETPSGKAKIVDALGFSVANTTSGAYDDQRATAAFIVRAVNSYAPLVSALREAIEIIQSIDQTDNTCDARIDVSEFRAALAAAEAA